MQAGALMIIFYGLSTLTTGILQGLGELNRPLINCCIALVLHFILLYFLLTVGKQNIYGVIYANIFFALVVCVLNGIAISRFLNYRQEYLKTFVVPGISAIIMAAAVALCYKALNGFLGNTIATALSILVGIVVYCTALVSLKGITLEELEKMPKGYLVIRLFRKLGLLH